MVGLCPEITEAVSTTGNISSKEVGSSDGRLMKAGVGRAKREKTEREKVHQKASERTQQRERIISGGNNNNSEPAAELMDPLGKVGADGLSGGGGGKDVVGGGKGGENGAVGGGKVKTGKKKMRSALVRRWVRKVMLGYVARVWCPSCAVYASYLIVK